MYSEGNRTSCPLYESRQAAIREKGRIRRRKDRDGGGLRVEVAHLERISKMSDGPTGRPSSEVNMKSAGIGRDVQP